MSFLSPLFEFLVASGTEELFDTCMTFLVGVPGETEPSLTGEISSSSSEQPNCSLSPEKSPPLNKVSLSYFESFF